MKSISFSCAIALLAFAFSARPATVTYTPGTGVLLYPENFFEANSNSIVQAIAGAFPGTGSGNASTNVAQGWSALQVFDDVTVTGTLDVGDLTADSFTTATPIGFSSGGHGATNAAGARSALGVVPGTDVQAQSARLQELADISYASGDFVYYDGANLVRIASTAAGRSMLTAADAAAQWSLILPNAVLGGGYDQGTWDGVTNKSVTADQFRDVIQNLAIGSNAIVEVTSPLHLTNGVLSINTAGLGGGGGVEWLVNEPVGSWYGRDSTTNWPLLSVTISSNDLPTVAGKYIFGQVSGIISNLSGSSATVYFNADVNGTRVFRDSQSVAGVTIARGRPYVGNFYLIYETSTTASLVCLGVQTTSSNPEIGGSGDLANSANALTFIATNITVNWSSNITLALGFECGTSTSTNEALGMRKVYASLLKYTDGASGTGDVVGPASSTTNNIAVFADATGKLLADGGVAISALATVADPVFTGTATFDTINTSTLTVTNPFPARGITNATASRFAVWGADYRLTNDVAETGTGAPVRATSPVLVTPTLGAASATSMTLGATNVVTELALKAPLSSPTLASPTLNDTVVFEQTSLSSHSDVTNFVADPSISTYQAINSDLTTAFTGVRFLHATNVAAGRQTTVLVFAGTNAAVSVALNSQFAFNTNLVSLTTGQVLPVSFYGYGSSPTNVVATLGTIYTR